jgi:hypothetical protein
MNHKIGCMKKIFVLALVAVSLAACKKSNTPDTLTPVINVSSPSVNQQFGAGANVNILASIFDNRELHFVHLSVTNKGSGVHVLHIEEHPDARSFELNQSFTTAAFTTYSVLIEAEDHAGNRSQVAFEVKSN